jgi:hypothetical protein
MGPRDISTDKGGWMDYDCGDDASGRRPGVEYAEEERGAAVVESWEAWEEGEGTESGADSVGVGEESSLFKLRCEGIRAWFQ